jgi:hypothetical protein
MRHDCICVGSGRLGALLRRPVSFANRATWRFGVATAEEKKAAHDLAVSSPTIVFHSHGSTDAINLGHSTQLQDAVAADDLPMDANCLTPTKQLTQSKSMA